MKKKYEAPQVEKIEFDYSETVVASEGRAYELYTQNYDGCNDYATGQFYVGMADPDVAGCRLKG